MGYAVLGEHWASLTASDAPGKSNLLLLRLVLGGIIRVAGSGDRAVLPLALRGDVGRSDGRHDASSLLRLVPRPGESTELLS